MKYLLFVIALISSMLFCEDLSETAKSKYKQALLTERFDDVKKYIKTYGVNVILDSEKNTPLHIVATRKVSDEERNIKRVPLQLRDDIKIIKYLIRNGANVFAKNEKGLIPHDLATSSRNFDMENYLLGSGDLAWSIIENKKLEDIATYLHIFSDELNKQDLVGNTPLHLAAGRSLEVVRLLLEKGANPYVRNKKNMQPINFANAFGKKDIVDYLSKYPYLSLSNDLLIIWALF